jgi:hypothetical protein
MPELTRTQTASRSAFLDLQDEKRLVNDGYEFLDEKRILLAAELLRQREAWREARATFMDAGTRRRNSCQPLRPTRASRACRYTPVTR